MTIKGIEGKVSFRLERYLTGSDFFALSGQFKDGLESSGLKYWIKKELPHKSYSSISEGLEILSGERLYSGNHICKKVKVYAQQATQSLIKTYAGLQLEIPFATSEIDLYDKNGSEILLFDDAIGVKRQKEKRVEGYIKTLKTVQTDVVELQKSCGGFEYITAGHGVKHWDIQTAISCWVCHNYPQQRLPIVAITDGAKAIRCRLWSIFGSQIVIVLDYYHLRKKMRELLSMVAWNKEQKESILKLVMPMLWEGKTDDCLDYLKAIDPRNKTKLDELIEYLTKHKEEIINYKKRKEVGKSIGSGRAEKAVDLIVAQRQKNKPIAWSEDGSHALSVLRADELNKKNTSQ